MQSKQKDLFEIEEIPRLQNPLHPLLHRKAPSKIIKNENAAINSQTAPGWVKYVCETVTSAAVATQPARQAVTQSAK